MYRFLFWLNIGLVALPFPRSLAAQYFGQNQVVYQTLKFEILRTEHFDIYYYPEEQIGVEYAALMAERWYARLSRLLNHQLSDRQVLILYASGPQFRQSNVVHGSTGEGTGGVTEILKRRIVLPFAGPLAETDHVIGHELVHAFQFDITGREGGRIRSGIPSAIRQPLWFIEGMAEYLSLGPEDPNTAMWMRDAVRDGLPDLRRLGDNRFFPYRYGQAVWAHVAGRWGDEVVGRILRDSRGSSLPAAFQRITGASADSVIEDWGIDTRESYERVRSETENPDAYGRLILEDREAERTMSLAPVLSPDGSRIVFLSSRELFSIDMFLADVAGDRVVRRLVRNDIDPHFESIQFISSAGAWDSEGRRFVFGGIRGGRPVLSIIDVDRGRREKDIRFDEMGEIFNPTWSPDGRYVAFTGLIGGLTDLFVYDLIGEQLERKTNDAFAELQPAWSPDGHTIAFVTDRFTTGLASLSFGSYRIGLLDVASGEIGEAPGFSTGKHINPQWNTTGHKLFFISDQNGISNVYNVDLGTAELRQVTNLYTGASGITGLSPALSVAAQSGVIAFTVYSDGGYHIYLVDDPAILTGEPIHGPFADGRADMLMPRQRRGQEVLSLRANPFFGTPSDTGSYARRRYRTKMGLDYIGQPSLIVGADHFGTFIGGGGSLFFSDMLGNHNIGTAVQFQGGVRDMSAALSYVNMTHRLNWGLTAQQTPYLSAFVGLDTATVQGQQTLVEETIRFRQTNRSVNTILQYPLSRVRRLEGGVGYSNISFGTDVTQRFYAQTGDMVYDTSFGLPSRPSYNFAQGFSALVYDNAIFGFTGPILGERYRLEGSTTIGSVRFQNAVIDLRKYVMPVTPVTVAAKLLHYGRYGTDAENWDVLTPQFIGSNGMVRGYGYNSFDFRRECGSDGSCNVYTDLFGAKLLVANLEMRFPPLGMLGVGGPFGPLPIDMVLFADGGLAWNSSPDADRAFFLSGGQRDPVFSAGVGLRGNLFGFAIVELDLVHPFDRPERGVLVQLGFTPGF